MTWKYWNDDRHRNGFHWRHWCLERVNNERDKEEIAVLGAILEAGMPDYRPFDWRGWVNRKMDDNSLLPAQRRVLNLLLDASSKE